MCHWSFGFDIRFTSAPQGGQRMSNPLHWSVYESARLIRLVTHDPETAVTGSLISKKTAKCGL